MRELAAAVRSTRALPHSEGRWILGSSGSRVRSSPTTDSVSALPDGTISPPSIQGDCGGGQSPSPVDDELLCRPVHALLGNVELRVPRLERRAWSDDVKRRILAFQVRSSSSGAPEHWRMPRLLAVPICCQQRLSRLLRKERTARRNGKTGYGIGHRKGQASIPDPPTLSGNAFPDTSMSAQRAR